jgi:hypothetical protein
MAASPLERPPGQVAALAGAGVEAATVRQRCVRGEAGGLNDGRLLAILTSI